MTTYAQKREYLIDKLGITTPLSLDTMERLSDEILFSRIHKLEVAILQETDNLALTPNSERIKERIAELKAEVVKELEPVAGVLAEIATENGNKAIRRAKANELMLEAKNKIKALRDELMRDANKYHAPELADLARSLSTE